MDIITGEIEYVEILQDFILDEFSTASVSTLLQSFNKDIYSLSYGPVTASRAVLVYSNSNYQFSMHELEWLKYTHNVIVGSIEQNVNVISIDMNCGEDDYYLYCAAMIKIFNIALSGKNLYIFKICNALAIGCMRDFMYEFSDNFCISSIIKTTCLTEGVSLLEELSYANYEEYSPTIIRFSNQEKLVGSKKYTQYKYNSDYMEFLSEFERKKGISTKNERERYLHSYYEPESYYETYWAVCHILRSIADGKNTSSYEDLLSAIEAEEITVNTQQLESSIENSENHEIIQSDYNTFSRLAYSDAVIMLDEIGKKESYRKG